MPLQLRHLPSPALFLEEILEPVIRGHIDFKRRDSFRIFVPDAESRQDIEALFLRQERLSGILIGKSILTLSALAQSLLLEWPQALPAASPPLQKKMLKAALQGLKPDWKLDSAALHACLQELQRIRRASGLNVKPAAGLASQVDREFRGLLREAGYGDLEGSHAEAWRLLTKKQIGHSLASVQECHWLGFRLPKPDLLDAIAAWQLAYPKVQHFLYLPPEVAMTDPEGILSPWLQRLSSMADSVETWSRQESPKIVLQPFSTPAHEVGHVLESWRQSPRSSRLLTPTFGPTALLFAAQFRALEPRASADAMAATESQIPAYLLSGFDSVAAGSGPIRFDAFLAGFQAAFANRREQLVARQDYDSLRLLDGLRQWLLQYAQAERWRPESKEATEWLEMVREEWTDFRLPSGLPSSALPLRPLDRPGLAAVETLFLSGMNDGAFPPKENPAFFEEAPPATLSTHEAGIALQQALGLARRQAILGFSQFSLAGRALLPSPLLEQIPGAFLLPKQESLYVSREGRHPYFSENLQREAARHRGELNLDNGLLVSLQPREAILEKLRRHPLSATYLDDYAKCPWRFFARWHLRLSEEPVEDLEMAPRNRGSLLHRLLESSFRVLKRDFFTAGKIPNPEDLKLALQICFDRLLEKTLQEPSPVPEILRRDQLERLRASVEALLEEERLAWTLASQRLLPAHLEWRFGYADVPHLEMPVAPGVMVPLTGAVDRIDLSEGGHEGDFVLYDYKSSGSDKLAAGIRNGLNLQLWIYIQAVRRLLYPRAQALGGLYWDVKELKRNQGMARREAYQPYAQKKLHGASQTFLKDEDYDELERKLEAAVTEILQKILAGDYALKPVECLGPLCDFRDICRYDDKASN